MHKTKPEDFSIVVVDDDSMVRAIIVEYLRKFGFRDILDLRNGRKAITVMNDKKDYDLIISDWEMPEADGLTLLKAVRKNPRRNEIKFILVTSQTSQERIKITQAAHWRVDAYLVKPFRGDALRDKVYEVLGIKDDSNKEAG